MECMTLLFWHAIWRAVYPSSVTMFTLVLTCVSTSAATQSVWPQIHADIKGVCPLFAFMFSSTWSGNSIPVQRLCSQAACSKHLPLNFCVVLFNRSGCFLIKLCMSRSHLPSSSLLNYKTNYPASSLYISSLWSYDRFWNGSLKIATALLSQ